MHTTMRKKKKNYKKEKFCYSDKFLVAELPPPRQHINPTSSKATPLRREQYTNTIVSRS
jgi:hypothetical protein